MPRLLTLLAAVLFVSSAAGAQPAEPDSTRRVVWSPKLIGSLSASQASYRHWKEGGSSTLAFTTALTGKAIRDSQHWKQTHDLRLAYGMIKQDTLAVRKADDVIHYTYSAEFKKRGPFNPTAAMDVRTQFAPGYLYDKNGKNPPRKVSDFLTPAAITQSLGLTYNPTKWFKTRLGVAGKETIVHLMRLRPHYSLDSTQAVRFELGAESRTELNREIFENVVLKSRLSLFAAFNKPDLPDAFWENHLAMKVNSWLHVNFEFASAYDRDFSSRLQIKEVLSVGVSLAII